MTCAVSCHKTSYQNSLMCTAYSGQIDVVRFAHAGSGGQFARLFEKRRNRQPATFFPRRVASPDMHSNVLHQDSCEWVVRWRRVHLWRQLQALIFVAHHLPQKVIGTKQLLRVDARLVKLHKHAAVIGEAVHNRCIDALKRRQRHVALDVATVFKGRQRIKDAAQAGAVARHKTPLAKLWHAIETLLKPCKQRKKTPANRCTL